MVSDEQIVKNYVYYISYAHGADGYFGFGAIEVYCPELIKSFNDVISIQEQLKIKKRDIKNPLVINFILLRTDE